MKENSLFTICYLYKIIIYSPNGDIDFFEIVAGVFEGDSLAPYSFYKLPRLHTKNINRYERKWSHTKKKGKIPVRNYHGCTLRRWSSASHEHNLLKLNICSIIW